MVYLMPTGTQTLPQISIFINSIGISLQLFEQFFTQQLSPFFIPYATPISCSTN